MERLVMKKNFTNNRDESISTIVSHAAALLADQVKIKQINLQISHFEDQLDWLINQRTQILNKIQYDKTMIKPAK